MKSNIPDHVPSSDDLKKLLEDYSNGNIEGYTPQQLEELADLKIEEIISECGDPVAHKVVALRILKHLINWHEVMSLALFELNHPCSIPWSKGQAQLELAHDTISRVSVSPNDFIASDSFDSKVQL